MLLLEFTLPPLPYNFKLQIVVAGSIALIELALFCLCLWSLKNKERSNYLLALLILTSAIAFLTGCLFNEYYYAEYAVEEYVIKAHQAILSRAKAMFTLSSLIGLVLAAITVLLRMREERKGAAEKYAK